jgi:hypothetical protein
MDLSLYVHCYQDHVSMNICNNRWYRRWYNVQYLYRTSTCTEGKYKYIESCTYVLEYKYHKTEKY